MMAHELQLLYHANEMETNLHQSQDCDQHRFVHRRSLESVHPQDTQCRERARDQGRPSSPFQATIASRQCR